MYSSTKDSQPSGDAWGLQSSKDAPMLASAIQPWQTHLGARTSLILHQDDAVMHVNIFSTKLEQLLNTSPKKGCRRSTRRDLGQGVLLEPSSKEVQGISFTHSDRGIFPGDVIVPIVNCLRVSLGLLAYHQPVTA